MQLSLERQIAVGFGVAIAVLLMIGVAAWWSLVRFERAFGRVEHTHQVLFTLEQVLVQALNVQTGSRGYALSGDPRFLEPFESGVRHIRSSLAEARRLMADNPTQLARLSFVESRVDQLIHSMELSNQRRQAGGLAATTDLDFLLAGKQTMDEIRALVTELGDVERVLLAERSRTTRRNAALTRAVLLLAIAAMLAFAAHAGARVQREFAARQSADRALQRSRALFETLFEQATDALVLVDHAGTIRRVNQRTESLFGFARGELVGQPVEQLMPGRFHAAHHAHRAGFAERPKFRAMGAGLELFARRKDGGEFPVDIMLSPLELEDGRAVLAAVREITERKAAAVALQKSADEVRDLYNRAPCGYHSLDEQGTYVAINDTELQWLGYSREEVVGRLSFRDVLTPESRAIFAASFPNFKTTGRVDNLEFQLQRKDGTTFWVSLSATAVFDERGRYLQSRSTVHDISARRAAEEHLARLHADLQQHSRDLETANRDLEAFSYTVSHDLRAPLRHMAGFAGLLEAHPGLQLDEMARRYIATITGAAKKMGQLIDDLLAFARLGRTPMKLGVVNTEALVRGLVAENLAGAAPNVIWEIGPLPEVPADLALLRQVWLNLLGNAVKYSQRAQPLRIVLQARRTDKEFVFSIQDNGVGFDPRYAEKLFQVFSRLHSEREFNGTGIGLALVHRIITRHGGRVWAESTPHQGATFFFSLPVHPPYPHGDYPASDPARRG